ncbi:hypothetical protein Q4I28_000479 [Leishmania naiffi]|uniref:Uncharacterized protein n=1 Tax=Leishmania naiffi TaxID=5678 RepID=A0AAW3C9Y9_9TRYP
MRRPSRLSTAPGLSLTHPRLAAVPGMLVATWCTLRGDSGAPRQQAARAGWDAFESRWHKRAHCREPLPRGAMHDLTADTSGEASFWLRYAVGP